MATGYWWDGHQYHRSEREARRRARVHARFHDPQLHWDGLWAVVAAVTVLPNMKWISNRSFMPFVYYRVALGVVIIALVTPHAAESAG